MLKLNSTSKEKEIQSRNLKVLDNISKEEENLSNNKQNNNTLVNPLNTTENNIKSDELKAKLQESYKIIRKLKEKLINSEQKYENKLIKEQERFYNAEKKISQLEFELVNSRLNRPKSNEEMNDTGTDTTKNIKPPIYSTENYSSLTSPPSILSPPMKSKINPISSHLSSLHTKPPLPSSLSKTNNNLLSVPSLPLGSIKSANSSSSLLIRENSENVLSNKNDSNFATPTSNDTNSLSLSIDTNINDNHVTSISTTTTTTTTTNSNNNNSNNNNIFKSNSSSSLLQKKHFNGTTATIHYLELKLNEKDKEMLVMKDNYEKTIKNLRSNLSKAKMESAIEIFELKNKIKELQSQIINEDELSVDKSFLFSSTSNYDDNDIDGRKSSLSLLSSNTSSSNGDDDDDNGLDSKEEMSSQENKSKNFEILNNEEDNNDNDNNNDHNNNNDNKNDDDNNNDKNNNNNDNDNNETNNLKNEKEKLVKNNLTLNSMMIPRPPSRKLDKIEHKEDMEPIDPNNNNNNNNNNNMNNNNMNNMNNINNINNRNGRLTSFKTKILKNNNSFKPRPPTILSSLSAPTTSPNSAAPSTDLNRNGNYQLQIQKYKTKIKNLQEQLANKNQLILELSMQLSSN